MKRYCSEAGFSMLELIVVLSIMAILMGTFLTVSNTFEEDARFRRAQKETYLIAKAASKWFKNHLYDQDNSILAAQFLHASQDEKFRMLSESGLLPSSMKTQPLNPWGNPYEIVTPTQSSLKANPFTSYGCVRSLIPDVFAEQVLAEFLLVKKNAPNPASPAADEAAPAGNNFLVGSVYLWIEPQELLAKVDQYLLYQDRIDMPGAPPASSPSLTLDQWNKPYWEVEREIHVNDSRNTQVSQASRVGDDTSTVYIEKFTDDMYSTDIYRRDCEIDPSNDDINPPVDHVYLWIRNRGRQVIQGNYYKRSQVLFPNR